MDDRPAAGWYSDPSTSGIARLRYWDGSAWTEHVAVGEPSNDRTAPSGTSPAVVGLMMFLLGGGGAVVCLVLAVMTSNSCGLFADGCDSYGQPASGFEAFVSIAVASAMVAVGGLLVAIISSLATRRGPTG